MSPDGRYVAWSGPSTDVVPNQPGSTEPPSNVFLFDRIAGTNRLLGLGSAPVAFSGTAGSCSSSATSAWKEEEPFSTTWRRTP